VSHELPPRSEPKQLRLGARAMIKDFVRSASRPRPPRSADAQVFTDSTRVVDDLRPENGRPGRACAS